MVNEGHQSLQYRITYSPSLDSAVQRLHYQQAANDDFMWRIVAQGINSEAESFSFQHVQGELFWDLSKKSDRWKTGLRFDARLKAAGDAGMLGLHWTNQVAIAEKWHGRFVVLSAYDVGQNASGEIGFKTRGSVFTTLSSGPVFGIEFYNSFGTLQSIKPFDQQNHQIGPFAFIPIGGKWNLFLGTLSGLTSASDSLELRTWATYSF